MAQASFGGFVFDLFRFNPGPRAMYQKKEDIERTGLDGIEIKHYGQRPDGAEFEAVVVLTSPSHDGMGSKLAVLLSLESTVNSLSYPGISLDNVELIHVTPAARSESGQGAVQFCTLAFRQVRARSGGAGDQAAIAAEAAGSYAW